MPTPATGGGAATQAGTNYQNRVAAWAAVLILAERATGLPWGLPASATLEFLRCETTEPVDDVLVGASTGGHAFLQAKHSIDLGKTESSDFASVISQFVCQYHERRAVGQKSCWDRPLDSQLDRLVLVTSPNSSAKVRLTLPTILERIRALTLGQRLEDAAVSQDDKEVLSTVRNHTTIAWQKVKSSNPTDGEAKAFLALVYVQVLDVDPGSAHESSVKNQLRTSVIRDPTEADAAWDRITQTCAGYAAKRTGACRHELQQVLIAAGIDLLAPQSYRADIDKLTNWSNISLQSLASLSNIRFTPISIIKITRDSTEALVNAATAGSIVVVGQPGAGKSGALFEMARQFQRIGDVLVFAVSQFDAGSLGSLRNEIGCQNEIIDILRNWPSTKPGFLLVDALDAARTEGGAKTFRDMIATMVAHGGRWKVIPSIRKFDLRYSENLQRLFIGSPPSFYQDPEFKAVRHIEIPILSDAELKQVQKQSPELSTIIASPDPKLLSLLRVPFNLRLVAELIGLGINVASLTPIRTQIELLDRYWCERVIGSDAKGDARESVLRLATTEMVKGRTLRIDRAAVANDAAANDALHQILSSQVLVEWQPVPESKPDRYVLTYSHHILFDYAVARLLLRGPLNQMVDWVGSESDLLLAVRPSILYHYQYLWELDPNRRRFWDCVFAFFNMAGIASTGKIIGPIAASQLVSTLTDCEILLDELRNEASPYHAAAIESFRHLMGAVHSVASDAAHPIIGPNAPPWAELLKEASTI